MREYRATVCGAAILVAGFGALVVIDARSGTLRAEQVTSSIAWLAVAFVGYGVISAATQRRSAVVSWKWLLVLGFVLRMALLSTTPTLSDDVYRYLWEGHLVTEGVSPYSFSIDDPAAEEYDIPIRESVNNPSLGPPYLPAAHAIFGVAAALLPEHPATMQLVMIAFDVLGAAMIIRLLDVARLPRRRVLLYWLNPLVIVEVAHGAHIDAIIVGLTAAGVLLSLRRTRPIAAVGAPVLIALATLTRPIAVLLVPVLWWRWSWRQRVICAATMIIPVLLAGAVSGFGLDDEGIGVFGSLRVYSDTFRFNGGIYHWLETWIGSQGLDDKGWNEPKQLTRLIITALTITALLGIFVTARRAEGERAALRLMALPLAVYVVLTPVLHPWYLLALLAFVPFVAPGDDESTGRWLLTAPWLALGALVVLTYLTYRDPNAFAELESVRRIVWIPTLALCAVAGWWRVRTLQRPPTVVQES